MAESTLSDAGAEPVTRDLHHPHPTASFYAEPSADDPAHVYVTWRDTPHGTVTGDPGPHLVDLNDPAAAAEQLYDSLTAASYACSWTSGGTTALDAAYHILLTTYPRP